MVTTSFFDIASDVKRTKQTKVAQIDGGIDGAPMRATGRGSQCASSSSMQGFTGRDAGLSARWHHIVR